MVRIQLLAIGMLIFCSESDFSERMVRRLSRVDVHTVDSIMCYQCTDCPEPFTEDYPYVAKVNNTNFLAQCTVSSIGETTKASLCLLRKQSCV